MTREFCATVGDREVMVSIVGRKADRWVLRIEDRELVVDAVRLASGSYSLIVDGRSVVVDVGPEQGRDVLRVGGLEAEVSFVNASRKRLSAAAKRATDVEKVGGDILAPIAGKVVKVLVAIGDDIAIGMPVAVLEAMKMENEIRADRKGVVRAVHVSSGDSLETRQKLMTLA